MNATLVHLFGTRQADNTLLEPFVDKFLSGRVRRRDTEPMEFGQFLRTLYEPRGFTQKSLADAAGLTLGTIHRGAASEQCPWRRSVCLRVFEALDAASPLTQNERENYTQLTGLTAFMKLSDMHAEKALAERRATKQAVANADLASIVASTPDEDTAHTWVMKLMEEVGAVKVLAGLEGLAAAWGIDLPPRSRADDLTSTNRRWALINNFVDEESGRPVTTITPIDPASVAKRAQSSKAIPLKPASQNLPKGRLG